jgi:hypothetical protein
VTRRNPRSSELLTGGDGDPAIMVRGGTLAEILEVGHEDAAADDWVLAEPEMARAGWLRTVPCHEDGHEIDGSTCEGHAGAYHYIDSKPGRGAFQGAVLEVVHAHDLEDDDPRKARYLAECAAMGRRSAS